jgi:hypothetical protein
MVPVGGTKWRADQPEPIALRDQHRRVMAHADGSIWRGNVASA